MLQAPVVAHRSGRGIVADDLPLALTCGSGFRPWLKTDVLIAIGTAWSCSTALAQDPEACVSCASTSMRAK